MYGVRRWGGGVGWSLWWGMGIGGRGIGKGERNVVFVKVFLIGF